MVWFELIREFGVVGLLVREGVKTPDFDLLVTTNEHVLGFYVPNCLSSRLSVDLGSHQGVHQVVKLLLLEIGMLVFPPIDFVCEIDAVGWEIGLSEARGTTTYPSLVSSFGTYPIPSARNKKSLLADPAALATLVRQSS